MPQASVRIRLEGRAVEIALSPQRTGSPGLNPHARVILERAEPGPPGSLTRVVICTVTEARALLDHISGLVDVLTGMGDPDAVVCAAARDAVRRALVASGA